MKILFFLKIMWQKETNFTNNQILWKFQETVVNLLFPHWFARMCNSLYVTIVLFYFISQVFSYSI